MAKWSKPLDMILKFCDVAEFTNVEKLGNTLKSDNVVISDKALKSDNVVVFGKRFKICVRPQFFYSLFVIECKTLLNPSKTSIYQF